MYQIYQVGYNETLGSISNKLGIPEDELRRLNGIGDNDRIREGSYIIIPTTKSSNYTSYIVKPNDNLYQIARLNNIDLDSLLTLNGLNKSDYIYPNQEILIPTSKMYITKENDNIEYLINMNIPLDKMKKLKVVSDQIITY